jgi:hypothetical protein
MSGLALLKALTMFVRLSVSGGVWLVQNLTSVALDAQLAPVTGVGSALPPEAAGAADPLLAALAGAEEVLGLAVVLAHAPTRRVIAAPSANHRNGPERGLMAPPNRLLPTVAEKVLRTDVSARGGESGSPMNPPRSADAETLRPMPVWSGFGGRVLLRTRWIRW